MHHFNLSKTIFSFSLQNHIRTIVLSHNNSLSSYAFLNIDLSAIDSQFTSKTKHIKSELNFKRYIIKNVQKENYGPRDLDSIQNQTKSQYGVLNKYANELNLLKNSFSQLNNEVIANANGENIFQWLYICRALEIVESTVWSRLLQICQKQFQTYSLKQQLEMTSYIHFYIKNKFISFNYSPSKYIYRENYLVDLTNFRDLLKILFIAITRKSEGDVNEISIKRECLSKINDILEKVSKTYVMNFNQFGNLYRINAKVFGQLIKSGSIETLTIVLKFLSIIGQYHLQTFIQIEEVIIQKWKSEKNTLNNEQKNKLITRILAFWGNSFRHNSQLYNDCIKPYIQDQIGRYLKQREHSIWLFNIVACGIEDWPFIEKFLRKISNDLPGSNKYLHIVSHYLSIINNMKGYCSYAHCSQHPLTRSIVNLNGKAYLNCMERQKTTDQKGTKGLTFLNQAATEENPPEQWWLNLTSKAFQMLNKKYPHETNALYLDFEFCVFQIDAMMILNNVPIAIELSGSHYNHKNDNKTLNQKQGKKVLKHKILESYGIKLLQLNSTNTIQRNINSYGDYFAGTKYIREKVQNILKENQ